MTTTTTTTSARPEAHAEWERELLKAMDDFANDEWRQTEMCVEVEGILNGVNDALMTRVLRRRGHLPHPPGVHRRVLRRARRGRACVPGRGRRRAGRRTQAPPRRAQGRARRRAPERARARAVDARGQARARQRVRLMCLLI
jgi:hypothetical protein